MTYLRCLVATLIASSVGFAHADLVDLRVTRGTFDRLNPSLFDELQFKFDDSAGAGAVTLSTFASGFGVLTGYAGSITSRDFGYSSVAYLGITASGGFMIYEPCGPLLPSPASQCYVLLTTPTNGLSTGIDPRAPIRSAHISQLTLPVC